MRKKKAGIVAFAFGVPASVHSNMLIARVASQKARELVAPVFTQLDVGIDPDVEVFHIIERLGEPPPTLKIAKEAVQWAVEIGIRQLWVVAAKPHLWRCLRDLKQAACEEGIKIDVCEEIEKYPADEWFCDDSTQERTRSRKAWERRERILKCLPFFIYKCIAS